MWALEINAAELAAQHLKNMHPHTMAYATDCFPVPGGGSYSEINYAEIVYSPPGGVDLRARKHWCNRLLCIECDWKLDDDDDDDGRVWRPVR